MAMTPQQVIDAARARYNAAADTFWSDAELLQHLYEACLELSRESLCIEYYDSSIVSVQGTQSYAYPARAIAIKRVVYDGKRLEPITMREDDRLTFFDSANTAQGEPNHWYDWGNTIYLRPIPDSSAKVIGVFVFREHDTVTAGSTLEIPSQWQPKTIDYLVAKMALKEKNYVVADRYDLNWQKTVMRAKTWGRQRRRMAAFITTQDDNTFEVPGVL